jgi:hypothetical protein
MNVKTLLPPTDGRPVVINSGKETQYFRNAVFLTSCMIPSKFVATLKKDSPNFFPWNYSKVSGNILKDPSVAAPNAIPSEPSSSATTDIGVFLMKVFLTVM